MDDPDFPAPPIAAVEYDISDKIRAAYEAYAASPEFVAFKSARVVESAFERLNGLAAINEQAVGWACYDWLHVYAAGIPYAGMLDTNAREDARFWAETAQPHELECYGLAAMDRLASVNALFSGRQIKRLAGALFRRMSPTEQAAFVGWVNKQVEEKNER